MPHQSSETEHPARSRHSRSCAQNLQSVDRVSSPRSLNMSSIASRTPSGRLGGSCARARARKHLDAGQGPSQRCESSKTQPQMVRSQEVSQNKDTHRGSEAQLRRVDTAWTQILEPAGTSGGSARAPPLPGPPRTVPRPAASPSNLSRRPADCLNAMHGVLIRFVRRKKKVAEKKKSQPLP